MQQVAAKTEAKEIKHVKVWENLQLVVLGLTILGQLTVGPLFLLGQSVWLVANVISLVRDFVLRRPYADKLKNATMTAITVGIIVVFFLL